MLVVQRASAHISKIFQSVIKHTYNEYIVVRRTEVDGTYKYTEHHYGKHVFYIASCMVGEQALDHIHREHS